MSRLEAVGWLWGLAVLAGCANPGTDPAEPRPGPPTVLAVEPAPGLQGASVTTRVTVRFSEPVRLTPGTWPLRLTSDAGPVPGYLRLADDVTLELVPDEPLAFGTGYQASLGTGVSDLDGERPAPTDWSFSTEGLPPPETDAAALLAHASALAHDSLRGRGSGTPDEVRAAEYLRDRLSAYGLEAAVTGYLQPFVAVDYMDRTVSSQNVLAVLPGAGELADEWVVVGAHYDHVGVTDTETGSMLIHNGADDNASGTSVLLEVARRLGDWVADGGAGSAARRSVAFQAYGAEERALLGSRHFCANPTFPLASVAGMLNFDMVGRLRERNLQIAGLWTSPRWGSLLDAHKAPDLAVSDFRDCHSCSDYACFRQAGRPALWLFTGFHDDYHTPSDDTELLNVAGMKELADLALRLVIHLAVRPQPLPFGSVTP